MFYPLHIQLYKFLDEQQKGKYFWISFTYSKFMHMHLLNYLF